MDTDASRDSALDAGDSDAPAGTSLDPLALGHRAASDSASGRESAHGRAHVQAHAQTQAQARGPPPHPRVALVGGAAGSGGGSGGGSGNSSARGPSTGTSVSRTGAPASSGDERLEHVRLSSDRDATGDEADSAVVRASSGGDDSDRPAPEIMLGVSHGLRARHAAATRRAYENAADNAGSVESHDYLQGYSGQSHQYAVDDGGDTVGDDSIDDSTVDGPFRGAYSDSARSRAGHSEFRGLSSTRDSGARHHSGGTRGPDGNTSVAHRRQLQDRYNMFGSIVANDSSIGGRAGIFRNGERQAPPEPPVPIPKAPTGLARIPAVIITTLLYYAATQVGLAFAFENTNVSPVWPPSGVGAACVLLLGYTGAVGVYLGAILGNMTSFLANDVSFGTALATSMGIGIGNTLEGVVVVAIMLRWYPGPWHPPSDDLMPQARGRVPAARGSNVPAARGNNTNPMITSGKVFGFMGPAAVLGCGVATFGGTSSLVLAGIVDAENWGTVATTWFLGDYCGLVLVTPWLVSCFAAMCRLKARGFHKSLGLHVPKQDPGDRDGVVLPSGQRSVLSEEPGTVMSGVRGEPPGSVASGRKRGGGARRHERPAGSAPNGHSAGRHLSVLPTHDEFASREQKRLRLHLALRAAEYASWIALHIITSNVAFAGLWAPDSGRGLMFLGMWTMIYSIFRFPDWVAFSGITYTVVVAILGAVDGAGPFTGCGIDDLATLWYVDGFTAGQMALALLLEALLHRLEVTEEMRQAQFEMLGDRNSQLFQEMSVRTRVERELRSLKDSAEQNVRDKTDFLIQVSHAIRTSMTAVVGAADAVQDCSMDSQAKELVGDMQTSAGYLLRLSNELMDLSQFDGYGRGRGSSTLGVAETVWTAVKLAAAQLKPKVGLSVLIDDGTPTQVVGDSTRLTQLLVVLLTVATLRTTHGEIAILARTGAPPRRSGGSDRSGSHRGGGRRRGTSITESEGDRSSARWHRPSAAGETRDAADVSISFDQGHSLGAALAAGAARDPVHTTSHRAGSTAVSAASYDDDASTMSRSAYADDGATHDTIGDLKGAPRGLEVRLRFEVRFTAESQFDISDRAGSMHVAAALAPHDNASSGRADMASATRMVSMMHGSLSSTSRSAGYSVIKCTLPFEPVSARGDAAAKANASAVKPPRLGKLLIVSSYRWAAQAMAHLAQRRGYEPVLQHSLARATRYISTLADRSTTTSTGSEGKSSEASVKRRQSRRRRGSGPTSLAAVVVDPACDGKLRAFALARESWPEIPLIALPTRAALPALSRQLQSCDAQVVVSPVEPNAFKAALDVVRTSLESSSGVVSGVTSLRSGSASPKLSPPGPAAAAGPAATASPSAALSSSRGHVLLADASGINLRVLAHMVDRLGFSYDAFSTGKQVTKAVENECTRISRQHHSAAARASEAAPSRRMKWDVMLVDVLLPDVDGLTLCATIQRIQFEHGLRDPPIVVGMGTFAFPDDATACLDAGMASTLTKPVTLTALGDKLKSVLRHMPTAAHETES